MSKTFEQLGPVISALDERITANLGAYPVDSASGAVANYADGAEVPVKSLKANIKPVQNGTPSSENIVPVEGWTDIKIEKRGKNLLNPELWGRKLPFTNNGVTFSKVSDGVYHASGTAQDNAYWNISFYSALSNAMPCGFMRGSNVFLSVVGGTFSSAIGYFKSDGSYSSIVNGSVMPDDAVALRAFIAIQAGVTVDADFSIQLEIGSAATTFETYESESVSVSIPTEIGTVYGGTLDVATGLLTITDVLWTKNTADMNNNNDYPGWKDSGIKDLIGTGAQNVYDTLMCNVSPVGTRAIGINTSGNNDTVFLSKAAFGKTQDDWKSLQLDIQIIVPLASPITYQLPKHVITSFPGFNNIWTNAGNVDVGYRADTTMYINRKIAEAINALA
jgi:hypothetical protein